MVTTAENFVSACGGQWLAVVVAIVFSTVILIAGDWITDWYANTYRGEGNVNARVGAALPRWVLSAASPIGIIVALAGYSQRAKECGPISLGSTLDVLMLGTGAALTLLGLGLLLVRHRLVNKEMRLVDVNDIAGRRAMRVKRRRVGLLVAVLVLPGIAALAIAGW